jgi:hypothetical protein
MAYGYVFGNAASLERLKGVMGRHSMAHGAGQAGQACLVFQPMDVFKPSGPRYAGLQPFERRSCYESK